MTSQENEYKFKYHFNKENTYGILYIKSGVCTEQIIMALIRDALKQLHEKYPEEKPLETKIKVCLPTNREGHAYNFAYAYVSNWRIFNALTGLNFDGTPRKIFKQRSSLLLKDIDQELFEGYDEEDYKNFKKSIRSVLNIVSPESFDIHTSVFNKSLVHPMYMKHACEELIKLSYTFKIYVDLVAQLMENMAESELYYCESVSTFVLVLNHVLKELYNTKPLETIKMAVALYRHKLIHSSFLLDRLEQEIAGLNCDDKDQQPLDSEDLEPVLKAKEVFLEVGDILAEKQENKKRMSKMIKDISKLKTFKLVKSKRFEFMIEDLEKFKNEEYVLNKKSKLEANTSTIHRDWLDAIDVEEQEPLVKIQCAKLNEEKTHKLRKFHDENPECQVCSLDPEGELYAAIELNRSFAHMRDPERSHHIISTFKLPLWVTEEIIYDIFEKYSTSKGYPIVKINRNNGSCNVEFSPDPGSHSDAEFALQVDKLVTFKHPTKTNVKELKIFNFAKSDSRLKTRINDTPSSGKKNLPSLNKGRRFIRR